MRRQAETKREHAARFRRMAQQSPTANDRAFFMRQAQRLDHQATELEKRTAVEAESGLSGDTE
jgi:hypothetical protein